jgi:hypothetical protein
LKKSVCAWNLISATDCWAIIWMGRQKTTANAIRFIHPLLDSFVTSTNESRQNDIFTHADTVPQASSAQFVDNASLSFDPQPARICEIRAIIIVGKEGVMTLVL